MAINRLLLVLCAVLLWLQVSAFEVGGVAYEVTSGTNVDVVERWPIYEGDVVVPASVRYNGQVYAVTGIARGAFADAEGLTSIRLSEGLKSIGIEAFKGCMQLQEVVVPNSVTEIGLRAFYNCGWLQRITLGTGVTMIPYAMCMDCYSLRTVSIPDQVTTVGSYAFANTPIVELSIGRGVVTIESNAFSGCKQVRQLNIGDMAHWCGFDFYSPDQNPLYYARTFTLNGEAVTSIVVPEGVEELKPYAFAYTSITSITLPQTLKTFHVLSCYRAAFASLDLPNSVTTIVPPGITVPYITSLRSLTIGSGVKVLEAGTFKSATNLAEIHLSEGLEAIYDYVFGETPITEIVIPNSVTTVSSAFVGCTKLQKVTFGTGLEHLDHFSFRGCPSISEIHIPIRYPEQIMNDGIGQFGSMNSEATDSVDRATCVLYVPLGSAEYYRNHPLWGQFVNISEEGASMPGDVDGNGVVDIDDVNQVINCMIHKPVCEGFIFENADYNGDGVVDIDDLNLVINKMVHKG